jgi:hypothetical protein
LTPHNTYSLLIKYSSSTQDATSSPKQGYAPSASTFTSKSASISKHEMSKERVATYLSDPTSSQIIHRHNSTEESIEVHTISAQSQIDKFDAIIAKNKN